jgi:gliding motility associated protien GldN
MKTTKFILVTILMILAIDSVKAQVIDPSIFPDQVFLRENTMTRKPIPYIYVRESDVMWSKRVWRTLDLREKFNHPLYYPETRINNRASLYDVIKLALLEGTIQAFDNPAMDDEFKVKMSKATIEGIFTVWDSTRQVEDPNNPGTFILAPLATDLNSNNIKAYWMKEDWFFDKQRSVMDVRILGLCPMKEKADPGSGEIIGYSPIFWVYFPQCRPIFAKSEVFNTKNDGERRSLDDLFWKRMFASYIHKESNVYDRPVIVYSTGIEALLESDRIKTDISIIEHDLWHL